MQQQEKRDGSKLSDNRKKNERVLKMFSPEGRPYNVNQAKVAFKLNDEDDRDNIILDVAIYKYAFEIFNHINPGNE